MSGFAVRFEEGNEGVDCNENIGPTGMAVVWVMVAFALTVVMARVYAQVRVTKQSGLSDWLMICSVAVMTGFASLISVQFHFGWGRHQQCIDDMNTIQTQLKFNITSQAFGIMGSTFGRLSFIIFMLSLFGTKDWVLWTLRVLFVMQVVTNVGAAIMCYAQCSDSRALYDPSLQESLCLPAYIQTYIGYAHTSFNGACDLFLAALPTAMVWRLQMATKLKVGLAILLGMDLIALVGLVMKCIYLNALSFRGDFSYNTVPMFTWIVVECALVDIAASVPLLRPLFKRRFGGLKGSRKTGQSHELPQYVVRSGQTESSGFSKLGKGRTMVKSSRHTHRTDADNDSEDIILSDMRNNSILVKQEYSVNYGDSPSEELRVQGGEGSEKGKQTRSPSVRSLDTLHVERQHRVQNPPSVWSRVQD